MFQTTEQFTFIQTPIHISANIETKPYNIIKTSNSVINIPESMEISIKGPMPTE